VAEFVYGEPLSIPGEQLTPTANPVDPGDLISEHMVRLRTVQAAHNASPSTFVHSSSEKFTHVFLRQDAMRKALQPLFSGPYRILSRKEKPLKIHVRGRPVTVSTDRVKPAYILNETNRSATTNSTQSVHTRP
jgi:cleavage and polyadenylation specificity factor subunit 1